MVKVRGKPRNKSATSLVESSANETYVLNTVKENEDQEMKDLEENSEVEISEEEGGESEEKSDSDMSEEAPLKKFKAAPKKGLKEVKESEPKANLGKVLKAKGRNKKTEAVDKKANNSDSQVSKPSSKKEQMLDLILNGLSTMDTEKGVSFQALKKYILDETNNSSYERVRPKIKAALEQGFQEDLILRPKGTEKTTGLQGSFKLNKTKYASRNSKREKQDKKTKDAASTKVPKSGTSKKPLKVKSKEAESIPKKASGNLKHRRSVSEDIAMSEFKTKRLKKSKSLEDTAKETKKVVKKKATPKKKS